MGSHHNFSIASDNLPEFIDSLQKQIASVGKPALAILFINADLDITGINQYLTTENIPHIGASSAGELCNGHFSRGMYSGLFLFLPEGAFKLFTPTKHSNPALSGEQLGIHARKSFKNPGIFMLIASNTTQTDLLIQQIQEQTNPEIPLYGGHAFDNMQFEQYTVFSNNYISHNGLVAIILDCDQIEMIGDSYSGWSSIGTAHTITKSIEHELLEIDGEPALDVFTRYFDYVDLEKVASGQGEEYIIGNHPLEIVQPDGSISLKSPIQFDLERKSMLFFCSIPEGTQFRFCSNPKIEISDNLIERVKRIQNQYQELDGLLITSCVSRFLTLGPYFKSEVKRLYEIWGQPTVGFLSGGEIGNVHGINKSCFHNVTCIVTGLKVK